MRTQKNVKKNSAIQILTRMSEEEKTNRASLVELFKQCPIPDNEILANAALFLTRKNLSHILFLRDLYEKILPVHGVIMEFGTRWGRNLALFEALRGILEPFNYTRKIVGFDTFEGFIPDDIGKKDGTVSSLAVNYAVTPRYEEYLERILDCHEQESPIAHIKKHELIKGDIKDTLPVYLKKNPETIIALAHFDLDLYATTRACLTALKKHLTKGAVIGFDELNLHTFPGETAALQDTLGLDAYSIRRTPYSSVSSYIVIE